MIQAWTGVWRAICNHAVIVGEDTYVSSCEACKIRKSVEMGRVSSIARFVTYHGSIEYHHGDVFHVVAAADGLLTLVEVAPEKWDSELARLSNCRFASVQDLGYAGRYEALEVAEAAEALKPTTLVPVYEPAGPGDGTHYFHARRNEVLPRERYVDEQGSPCVMWLTQSFIDVPVG